jgi:hypothetical protein
MERKTIELGGICRNLPDNIVKDGLMHELINLRPKDGALRPVGMKDRVDFAPRNVRFIHKISDTTEIYIGCYTDTLHLSYWVLTNGIPGSETVLTDISSSNELNFAALKNSLLISDNTTEIPYLLVFDEESGIYRIFAENFIPTNMPNLLIQRLVVPGDDENIDFYCSPESNPSDVELAEYVKMLKDKADKGYLSGRVLVRFAWELFDGTLIRHTLPDLVATSEITTSSIFGETMINNESPGWKVTTDFKAFDLQFKVMTGSLSFFDFCTKYQNIIRGLKIFVSLPKSPEQTEGTREFKSTVKRVNDIWGSRLVVQHFIYSSGNLNSYLPSPNSEQYFLLKEYKLNDLKDNAFSAFGIPLWTTIDSETVQDLSTREQMDIDNFTHHQLFAKRLFSYNERIFLGDIKNTLSKGFSLEGLLSADFDTPNTGNTYQVGIEYDILVDGNKKLTVFTGWTDCNWYNHIDSANISFNINCVFTYEGYFLLKSYSYWGYPDSRATMARVYVQQDAILKLVLTQPLESYPLLNFSLAKGRNINGLLSSFPDGTLTTGKTTYYDYNRVQATELNNPFYYPAINSYRIGLGKILGMSSNAIALSTGQFGQFPVYCFTTDGIWTMSIGTGETLINSINPLSRDVCNNPASITPIDGGTAFTSGKGLFIISGNQVIEISETAEGSHTSRITNLSSFINMLSQADNTGVTSLTGIQYLLCAVPFLTYLAGAVIGHDYINSELIVSNDTYNYSWVYSIKYKSWFKINDVFERFVNDFPGCYAWKTGLPQRRFDINAEDFRSISDDLALTFGETRPIKLSGPDILKKLHRLLLGGNVKNDISPAYRFQVAVFSSTDGKTWLMLNNNRTFATDETILLGRSQYSCKYFIVVFGGHQEISAYFNYLTIDFEDRYQDKLR